MSVIKPRTRGKRLVKFGTRLDQENQETLYAYAAFLGEVGESYIIDVQHWRHYYLIMGMVWGLLIAGRAWLTDQARVAAAAPVPV